MTIQFTVNYKHHNSLHLELMLTDYVEELMLFHQSVLLLKQVPLFGIYRQHIIINGL